jgi:SPP1 family predicted phage head-tail adaptor
MAYNDLIVIQNVTETRDTYGEVVEAWPTYQSSWADIETISGSEGYPADITIYVDVKKFIIRYEEGKNVTSKMRIYYGSEYYYISSVAHRDRLRTELIASRRDNR